MKAKAIKWLTAGLIYLRSSAPSCADSAHWSSKKPPTASAPHSFDALRPLLSLSDLQHMSFVTEFDMIIGHSELAALFKALPRLESFVIPWSAPVDISCLTEIARIAQRLQTLELNWCTPLHPTALPRVYLPFAQLKALRGPLCFDLPPIAVAEFLEDVLPPECSVPETWGSVYDVRVAFAREREKDRRRRARARVRAWAYIGPVDTGQQP